MSWHTPFTFVAGTPLTAAQLNNYVSDNTGLLKTSIDDDGHIIDPIFQSKTAGYTIVGTDDVIICSGASSFTITLPTAVGRKGKRFTVKQVGTGVITMASTSSQTIDAASAGSTQLFTNDALTFESDNANWVIV